MTNLLLFSDGTSWKRVDLAQDAPAPGSYPFVFSIPIQLFQSTEGVSNERPNMASLLPFHTF